MKTVTDTTMSPHYPGDASVRAAATVQTAIRKVEEVRRYRHVIATRRAETIRVIWRSRQLRYDRHGPIVAMLSGPDPGEAPSADIDDVINRLFRVGLSLSAALHFASGPAKERVQSAINETDLLIRDIRIASFERYRLAAAACEQRAWRTRFQEAMTGIDDLLESGLSDQSLFDLREASQSAHRAMVALDSGSTPLGP